MPDVPSFPLNHKNHKENHINHRFILIILSNTTKNTIDAKLFSQVLHHSCDVVIGWGIGPPANTALIL